MGSFKTQQKEKRDLMESTKQDKKKDKKEKKEKKEKKQVSDSDDEPVVAKKEEAPEEGDDAAVEKSRAWPKADNQMGKTILDLINQAKTLNQLKKGANETTKALNRGVAELVILAADTEPLEIILHLPLLCEDKNVPYVYVGKQADLGRACGVSRNIIAIAIMKDDNSALGPALKEMRDKVEGLLL